MSMPCPLTDHLLQLLSAQPGGLSEYQLIQALRQLDWPGLADSHNLGDPLGLYRTHFILFNALYRLNDALAAQGLQLEINPLCIRLLPRTGGQDGLQQADPLRDYYLDMSQLDSTGREQVLALLDGSLQRLLDAPAIAAALECLGLAAGTPQPSAAQIRLAYRKLASQHHPDRGGCTRRLQALNDAMQTLKQHRLL